MQAPRHGAGGPVEGAGREPALLLHEQEVPVRGLGPAPGPRLGEASLGEEVDRSRFYPRGQVPMPGGRHHARNLTHWQRQRPSEREAWCRYSAESGL